MGRTNSLPASSASIAIVQAGDDDFRVHTMFEDANNPTQGLGLLNRSLPRQCHDHGDDESDSTDEEHEKRGPLPLSTGREFCTRVIRIDRDAPCPPQIAS
ncbi:hypothetical protein CLV28_1686 [Sediminihabitans luteus]|uniref:Uncharacterized protein n=1 Tax=Sediminihabitans luteus TaxID=1138585 RepID=A0A2M9CQJ1_9CELL|nr:hypothetical protein CLV28_1686 [Sediminihabitans luteus]